MSVFRCHVGEGLDKDEHKDEEIRKAWRHACKNLTLYDEYGGEQYCVLHFPNAEKDSAKFGEVLSRKLSNCDFDFRGVWFPSWWKDFSSCTFTSDVDFTGATFECAAFADATFHADAVFTKATFCAECSEEKSTDFRRATFKDEAYFREAHFEGYTDFYRARFHGAVRFIGPGKAEERQQRPVFGLEGRVSFNRALIDKPELFSFDAVDLRPSWFVGVDSRKFRFIGVQWYGRTYAPQGTIDDEIELLADCKCGPAVDSPHDRLAQTCRELSTNAEENRDYPLSNDFHYWSMEAVRKQGWSRSWPITFLYWVLSGYGVRAARAFLVLFGICVAFAVFYTRLGPTDLNTFWIALGYSLGALARLNPNPRPNPPDDPVLFQYLVIVEGLLGPLQIGLLVLAIRRKVMR